MKKIPFIITLLLITLWGYTSWYWYTCNIQWLCDWNGIVKQQEKVENTQNIITQENFITSELNTQQEKESSGLTSSGEEISSPKLSAEDVLWESYVPPSIVASGSTSEISSSWSKDESEETSQNITEAEGASDQWDICSSPLIGPLSIGAENSQKQMKKLESFLQSKWYVSEVDGVFGENDLEAVKKLQLEYKEEMLDPWGITEPTWYVWRTTVATINDIACFTN